MRLSLGLDIGITSVGYGIIDLDSGKIIDAGVRLFPEAGKEDNESRRAFRGNRRLIRRRSLRKKDLIKLLKDNDLFEESYTTINPYDARIKGINNKLDKSELTAALMHICKHRGSSLEVIEDEKVADDGTKAQLAKNDVLIREGQYVCEIQKYRLEKNGHIRGIENNFRTKDYDKELRKILSNQSISEQLSEQIINIISRRRHFSDGPGSFISQSIYGKVYNDDGSVQQNMIEKMTGKCSIYSEELRAPAKAPSAEFFNLLNDLNNLRINNEPIEIESKQELIKIAFEKGSLTPKGIAKYLSVDVNDIKGFRLDAKEEPLITELKGFKELKKVFENHYLDDELKDFKQLDQISVILTKTKVIEERKAEIASITKYDELVINDLSMINKMTGYHSLSLKAIYQFNDEMYNSQENQMQIMTVSKLFEFARGRVSQKGKQKIAINDEAILSPVAMRSYRQAIGVVNAARKRYGEFDSIIVETTRAKNSQDEKNRIKETNENNEIANKEAAALLKDYPNIEINGRLLMKLRLYKEQDGKTGYIQQPIDLDLLIRDSSAYEIDHIIPISISLDDSYNNKTLVTRYENQAKGNLTPLMAYQQNKFDMGNMETYIAYIKGLKNKKPGISWKKYNNYLYDKDITRYENMKDFIARNLVDTSYANRLIFNTLANYFKDNDVDTKVHTVRGSVTSAFRKQIKGLEKDRDKDYSHHAIDALIVASVKKFRLFDKLLFDFEVNGKDIISKNTGEVIPMSDKEFFNDKPYLNFLSSLLDYEVTKYSHQIDTKPNRSISNQTIYSTRRVDDNDYVISKYSNIYDPKFFTLAEDIVNDKADTKYLAAKNDPVTFEKIKYIVNKYYDDYKNSEQIVKDDKGNIKFKFNPLLRNYEESGEYIRKYAKNNDGPIIKSLKYYNGKLGSCIDISNHYCVKNNKKVVLQQISPYRTDFYLDEGVYKFVTIKYANLKYKAKENIYEIDRDFYEGEKKRKKISNHAEYIFSLHRNESIYIDDGKSKGQYRFVGTGNDSTNVIELKLMFKNSEIRIFKTIGKSIVNLRKYCVDHLGNSRDIIDSKLKLKFK